MILQASGLDHSDPMILQAGGLDLVYSMIESNVPNSWLTASLWSDDPMILAEMASSIILNGKEVSVPGQACP